MSSKKLNNHTFYNLVNTIVAGLVGAIIVLIFIIVDATLIFSGALKPYLHNGIILLFISVIVLNIILPLLSGFKFVIGLVQESTLIIAMLMGGALAEQFKNTASTSDLFLTFSMLLIISSIIVSLYLFIIGYFQIANFIRFIPYSVIAGFLIGTACLIIYFSLQVSLGEVLTFSLIGSLFTSYWLVQWVPALVFAGLYILISYKFRVVWVIPLLVISAALSFYFFLTIFQVSIKDAYQWHLLLGPFPKEVHYSYSFFYLNKIDWTLLYNQLGNLLALLVLTPIVLLTHVVILEHETNLETTFKKELISSAYANFIASCLGSGFIGYHAVTNSLVNYKLGARTPYTSVLISIILIVILVGGFAYIAILPKFIFAGILLAFGIQLLLAQSVKAYKQFSLLEISTVIAISIAIVFFGLFKGMLLGLFLAVLIFLVNFSRLSCIKGELTGKLLQSNYQRDFQQMSILMDKGDTILIIQLQGYIFFGNAYKIGLQIYNLLNKEVMHYLLVDFSNVTAIDTSATYSFIRLKRKLEADNIFLIFVELKSDIYKKLTYEFHFNEPLSNCKYFNTLDYGLEWCENNIISQENLKSEEENKFKHQLLKVINDEQQVNCLMAYFEIVNVASNTHLLSQNELSDSMYFLEKGLIEAYLIDAGGNYLRLRKMGAGIFVGEMGFYLNEERSANIKVLENSTFYKITRASWTLMQHHDPHLASYLQQFIIRELTLRLRYANIQLLGFLNKI